MNIFPCRLLLLTGFLVTNPTATEGERLIEPPLRCLPGKHDFDEFKHKRTYRIGVQATRGFEDAYDQYNTTFAEYLTLTAGQRFDPPIQFEMVPYNFEGVFEAIEADEVDFLYAGPSIYSCIGNEVGASALATTISRLSVRGKTFDLDVYGGVIATRADNHEINTIKDLKGKVIGAGAISMLMAAQLQFNEMVRAGLSYVNDPKQVIFTGNQFDVVHGVLDGTFDVGFVRTDTIERTQDADGNLVDPDDFKIIEPKIYIMDDGGVFPFLSSTTIYPEWPLASMTTVTNDVAYEVQEALLAIGHHADAYSAFEDCIAQNGTAVCETLEFPYDFDPDARCDTTKGLAQLSSRAIQAGSFAGFRTTRSYFGLRDMQRENGFLVEHGNGNFRCIRTSDAYEGIHCPAGHKKRSRDEVKGGCEHAGLECREGHDCYCKPCVKAFEVDVYEYVEGQEDNHLTNHYGDSLLGCAKMSICGTVVQGSPITLRIYDNLQRDDATVTVTLHSGDRANELEVRPMPGTYLYEVTFVERRVQVEVLEIYVNGVQIPQSPIRVQVLQMACDDIYGINSQRVPDREGVCVCDNNTYEIMGDCMQSHFFFLIIFLSVGVCICVMVFFFLNYKRQQSDSVWNLNIEELHFNEPPEVIGQGAFGVVVLGQYRGTKVAVKRVLPPALSNKRGSTKVSGGSGDFGRLKAKSAQDHEVEQAQDKDESITDDVEAQADKKSKKGILSTTMSGSDSWDGFLDNQKNDNALKVLEAATASNHGSYEYLSQSRNRSQNRLVRTLPFWLRFDEQARRRREFLAEMRLLSKLRHPCITTVMGAVISSSVDPMLVMEYMDYGSLFDLLHNETMYTGGEVILQIVRDIVQGIQFLHASKPPILHGDLKAKNILVDSRFRAKVADFGFSHMKQNKTKLLQGTPFFMAPEYLRRKTEYNTACDIYSLSMILYEMYARAEPFEGEDPRKVLPKVCHPRINRRPTIPDACPPKMVDMMKKCWSANPFFRPSAKDLDYILVELSTKDAEPLEKHQSAFKENLTRKPTSLYDVFPKHIADALNAGQRVEPESHEIVTVVFSDIVGFTDISQTFSPLKVSNMLDRLYQAFDNLANKHHVFKVETIGDAYMGVTNLDGTQFDTHVKHIAEYAVDAIVAASKILIDEDAPDRGHVQIRVGFHSGPVVSNVIGSLNPRYGLFGDTVNTASRMESNSTAGRVLCSHTSAKLLETQASWIPIALRGKINVKGKGNMTTYWVGNTDFNIQHSEDFDALPPDAHTELDLETILRDINDEATQETGESGESVDTAFISMSDHSSALSVSSNYDDTMEQTQERVTKILKHYLLMLMASRPNGNKRTVAQKQAIKELETTIGTEKLVLEEATEYVPLPQAGRTIHKARVGISQTANEQIDKFVSIIVCMYNANPFHNFQHAAHVLTSAHKLLERVVEPDSLALIDDKAFGINSDKLAQFAVIFSALIHDLDHRGIPNFCLAKENYQLNFRYKGKALAEQNSADLAWEILMSPEFEQFRACIYTTEEELLRFRNFVVNIIIATEIFDPELARRRNDRWERAFEDETLKTKQRTLEDVSRQSTNVLEYMIQASDISHTMQNWEDYIKWNQRLLKEMCSAYKQGRFPNDPTLTWYKGEIKFMDGYVIPLATKLQKCGVFGEGSGDFLQNAKSNRNRWEVEGKEVVEEMLDKIGWNGRGDIPAVV